MIIDIPKNYSGGTLVQSWEYKDLDGKVIGITGRYEPEPRDGTKKVLPFFERDSKGWKCVGPAEPKPLFGLDKLAEQPETFVCVVEGEKAAAALHQLGWVAVSSIGGSESANKADWSPLTGRGVVIMPDNDKAGEKYALDVAKELTGLDIQPVVCALDGLPEKGDIVDWFQARLEGWDGYSRDDRISSLHDELYELLSKSEPIEVPSNDEKSAVDDDWPVPIPLPELMPPVQPFDFDQLPESFRPWVADIAKRQQSPPDFVAVGGIVSAASVIGRQCRIRPKCKDDWSVVPNLWGAVVGRPSTKKSPALSEAKRPLDRLVAEATEEHEQSKKAHSGEILMARARLKAVDTAMFTHAKEQRKGKDKGKSND